MTTATPDPQPARLPTDPRRTPPLRTPRYQSSSDVRLAFEIQQGGSYVKHIRPIGPFSGHDGDERWFLEDGAEIGVYPTKLGIRLELTSGLLDGCTLSMRRVAEALKMSPCSLQFERLYSALLFTNLPIGSEG